VNLLSLILLLLLCILMIFLLFSFSTERPIKMFEKLTDVVWTWELETTNIIMLKKYPEKPLLNVVVRILSIFLSFQPFSKFLRNSHA